MIRKINKAYGDPVPSPKKNCFCPSLLVTPSFFLITLSIDKKNDPVKFFPLSVLLDNVYTSVRIIWTEEKNFPHDLMKQCEVSIHFERSSTCMRCSFVFVWYWGHHKSFANVFSIRFSSRWISVVIVVVHLCCKFCQKKDLLTIFKLNQSRLFSSCLDFFRCEQRQSY
jgi:hypothetical protein